MKKLEYSKDQKLTSIKVVQVWLKEDLFKNDFKKSSIHPALVKIFNGENKNLDFENREYIKSLKKFILSATDLFILFLNTETKTEDGFRIGCRAFLTDRKEFIEITLLMVATNFAGCKCKTLEPPYEDSINKFIEEVYF